MLDPQVDKYRRGWGSGLPETPCGSGSTMQQTALQREWIADVVRRHNIRSIVDIGAGDLNWIHAVEWPHPVDYRAYDLVPRRPEVTQFDLLRQVPPDADLVMCLYVLNHLPEKEQKAAAHNLALCNAGFLLYTYWPAMPRHLDWGAWESVVINNEKNVELRLCSLSGQSAGATSTQTITSNGCSGKSEST